MTEGIGFLASERKEKRCSNCGAEIPINTDKCSQCGEISNAGESIGFVSKIKGNGVKEERGVKKIGFLSDLGSVEETAVEPTVGFLVDMPGMKYLRKTESLEELSELKDETYEKIRKKYLDRKKIEPGNKEKLNKNFQNEISQLEKEYDFMFRKIKMFQGEEIIEKDNEVLNKDEVSQEESKKYPIGF